MEEEKKMGWVSRWLFTTNHKDIGILYIITALYFGFLGAALSLLIRVQLAFPDQSLLTGSQYNQAVTLHGLIMVLWFLSPLAFGFANYFVPLQIGAEDMAFPRLNAMSYWLYLWSGLLAAIGLFVPGGAIAGGWTVYAPLSSLQFSPGLGTTLGGAGLLMLIASVTISTVNFLVTIIHERAPGMTWSKIPMFTWFIFLTVVMMLLAFPSIFAGVVMLALDRIVGTDWFSSLQGGALLWDNVFWFFGHPEVYIVLFPALGAIADIIPRFAQRPLFAKKGLMASGFVAAVISLIVYGHHMYLTPIILPEKEYFTVVTEAISLPFGFFIFALIGTLYKARIRYLTPMLFALASPVLFMIGGITGVFNSSVALDQWLRGTYWVVGHFHTVMVGATFFGLFAAIYYWWPRMVGRMYDERLGKVHFWGTFIGFTVLSLAMSGLIDMPRRVFTYTVSTGWGDLNLIATIGAAVALLSQLVFVYNAVRSIAKGPRAGPNPWGAGTREWLMLPAGNEPTTQPVTPAVPGVPIGPLVAMASAMPASHGMGGFSVGSTETLSWGESYHTTHRSSRPLTFTIGLFLVFLGVGLGLPLMIVGLLVVMYSLMGWAIDDLRGRFGVPESPAGERWPFGSISKVKLGAYVFIASDIIFFSVLFSSYAFVRFASAAWPAVGSIHEISLGGVNTILLLTSGLTTVMALQSIRKRNVRHFLLLLAGTLLLGSTFLSIKATEWWNLVAGGFTFSSGLPATAFYTLTGVHAVHVAVGLLFVVYLMSKALRGGFTREKHEAVEMFTLYWAFVDLVWLFIFPIFYLT